MDTNPVKSTLFTWDLSLPLDCGGGLGRYVVDYAGGAGDFGGYAVYYGV